MTYELVIFDCDGVLVDSEGITNRLLVADLARYGLRLTEAEAARLFVGGTMPGVRRQATAMGAALPESWLDDIYAAIYATLARGTGLIDGVEALLDALDARNVPYAVGSNGSEQKMQITLGQHPGVYDRLKDRLFSAHTYGVAKPDPGLFLLAAARFGVAPARCVVIDDSATGCTAASRAGMRCLGLAEHDDGAELAATGAQVIHSLREAPALLGL